MTTLKQLRELLEKAGEYPKLEPVGSCGKVYAFPMCDGQGDIEDECISEGVVGHDVGINFSVVGIQVYGIGEAMAAMEKLIPLVLHKLPALLNALEYFQDVAECANDQWGDDYLWKKGGLDKQIGRAREVMKKLNVVTP